MNRTPEQKAKAAFLARERRKDPAVRAAHSKDMYERWHSRNWGLLSITTENVDSFKRIVVSLLVDEVSKRLERRRETDRIRTKTNSSRRETRRLRAFKRREMFRLLKIDRPCYDCGGMFPPEAMDWDHTDQSKKSFNVGVGVCSHTFDEVVDEIAKCQLVCATCHRIRTFRRRTGAQ